MTPFHIRRFGLHTFGIGPFHPVLRDVAFRTPGLRWDASAKGYLGYRDAVDAAAKKLRNEGAIIKGAVEPIDIETAVGLNICYEKLRDYQKYGVKWVVSHAPEGCLLADDCSLGKTIQAIRAARALKTKTVVICPAFVKLHWMAEIKKWWRKTSIKNPIKSMLLATTKPIEIAADVDVVVINYDIVYAWLASIQKWGAKTLIIDELHAMMSPDSRRTKAVRALARSCDNRIGMTATPKPSHVRDLWSALDVLSEARFGEKFWGFGLSYCGGKQETIEVVEEGIQVPRVVWRFDGSSNEMELQERLQFMMLRRTAADVGLELPKITRQIIELEVKKPDFKPSAITGNASLRRHLDRAADLKIPQVIAMAVDYVNAGRRLVVFTYRKMVAHQIAEGIGKALASDKTVEVVTGETSQVGRKRIVDSKPDVLCATMDSLGAGISLAYADTALFAELHYVPSVLYQCERRVPRTDSESTNVLIVYAIARRTADDLIRKAVIDKMAIDQKVIGKNPDTLLDTLDGGRSTEDAATKLKRIYERLVQQGDDD